MIAQREGKTASFQLDLRAIVTIYSWWRRPDRRRSRIMEPPLTDDLSHNAGDELLTAARNRWSGQLFFSSQGQVKGSVSFTEGQIAWAVSADHKEDLGTLLWRLGRVTEQQIDETRKQYEKHHGARKLGSLLEEAGLIQRAVLRRCLLLHTRMVMTSLLTCGDLEATWSDADDLVDDGHTTFDIEEVMPELLSPGPEEAAADPEERRWWEWRRRNETIAGLDQVEGYIGAALVSSDGELIAADGQKSAFSPATLGFFLASSLESIDRVTAATLGRSEVMYVDLENGGIAARWVTELREHLVFILLDASGKLDAAGYVLNAATPSIARIIARWKERGWDSPIPS